MKNADFMDEYLNRLAFSLAQFWPAEDVLPDDEARDDETYYRVAINRLSIFNRAALVKKMRQLCQPSAGFFTTGTSATARKKTIDGVLARFPLLQDAEHEAMVMSDRI